MADWVETYNPGVTAKDNSTILDFNKNKTGIIKASINGNEITIVSSCVSEFNFYVYPELVDITKPIRFNVNNKTFFKVIPKADKGDLAQEFAKSKRQDDVANREGHVGFRALKKVSKTKLRIETSIKQKRKPWSDCYRLCAEP